MSLMLHRRALLSQIGIDAHVGSFNTGTGVVSTTVQVTGVGFQPKAVIFWWSGRTETTDAAGAGDQFRGVGWATGTSSRAAIANFNEDGESPTDSARAHREDCCVIRMSTASDIDGLLDLQSFDVDGFTLVVDDQFTSSMRVHYLALGGDDLTDVATGRFQQPTNDGTQDITSVGFEPDCVLFMGVANTSAPPANPASAVLLFGASTAGADQAAFYSNATDNAEGTPAVQQCRSGRVIHGTSGGTNFAGARAAFVSALANGFQLDWDDTDESARNHYFLALRGARFAVGGFTTRTDGNNIVVNGLGIRPRAVLFVSATIAESPDATGTQGDWWSMGAATGPLNRAAMFAGSDGDDPIGIATAVDHDSVYLKVDASGTVQGVMDLVSLDADGFTCVMDDADPSAAFVWYVAFG